MAGSASSGVGGDAAQPRDTDQLFAAALGLEHPPPLAPSPQAPPPDRATRPLAVPQPPTSYASEPMTVQPGTSEQWIAAVPPPNPATGRLGAAPAGLPGAPPPVPAPAARRPSWWARRRARVRRTRRTLRHIDPWSVLKVSVLLYACLYVAVLATGVVLWNLALRSGLVDNLESFIAEIGAYEVWRIDGAVIFARARVVGLVLAAAGVALNVVMTIVFNLISDLVGGIRVIVLEEDVVDAAPPPGTTTRHER